MANHPYIMDYIDDKPTYLAVMFTCELLKQGKSIDAAAGIACRYYGANKYDVLHFVAQRSGRNQANKKGRKY